MTNDAKNIKWYIEHTNPPVYVLDSLYKAIKVLDQHLSKDMVEDFIKHKIDYLEDLASIETNEGRWREEEKYLYAISVLEEVVEYMNMSRGCEK